MRYGSVVQSVAASLYSALIKDLPDIHGRMGPRRPQEHEVSVRCFLQTWGSTALGFGGVGGQALTSAYTVVVECDQHVAVYFNGRLAYVITDPTDEFWQDVMHQNMEPVCRAGRYRRKQEANSG